METTSNTEAYRFTKFLLTPALIGSLALSGCSPKVTGDFNNMTPSDRLSYDYLSGFRNDSDRCFDSTPFSPGLEASLSYDTMTDIMTVTASNGEQLLLSGLKQTETTLLPVDEASKKIFDAYGCTVGTY